MKLLKIKTIPLLAALTAVLAMQASFGAIVVQHEYLFEDPTKSAGDALGTNAGDANNRVTDTVGSIHMQNEGSSGIYSVTVPSGATVGTTSTLSADFNGADGHVVAVPNGTYWGTAIDNFGIEGWVRPESNTGTRPLFVNGYNNMLGVYQVGNEFQMVLHTGGNNTFYDMNATLTLNEWTHVAFVRDSGTATLYINGVSNGSTTDAVTAAPNAHSWIGGRDSGAGAGFDGIFDGQIDTVRYFTFNPGDFQVSDLDVIPEPSTIGLLLISGLAAVLGLRKRKR